MAIILVQLIRSSTFIPLQLKQTESLNSNTIQQNQMIKIKIAFNVTGESYRYKDMARCKSKRSLFRNANKQPNFIFIHVPKTGGSTIEKKIWHRDRGAEHKTIVNYMNICPQSQTYCCDNDYFIFGFVRNPYLRTISMFNYFKRGGNQHQDKKSIAKIFKNFNQLDEFVDYFMNNTRNDTILSNHIFFKPFRQVDWLLDPEGVYVPDFIGRFEKFDNELKRLSAILNMNLTNNSKLRMRVTVYNKSELIITAAFVDFINKFMSDDFRCFNYKKIHLNRSMTLENFENIVN